MMSWLTPARRGMRRPPGPGELSGRWVGAGDLVRQARAEGVALTGPDGLLKALTKTVLEAALQEMTEHRYAAVGREWKLTQRIS